MSWSVNAVGKPGNVVAYLKAESERLTGQSKIEFDDALPLLIGIVEQNFRNDEHALGQINLIVSGTDGFSGTSKYEGGLPLHTYRNCNVKPKPFYGNIV